MMKKPFFRGVHAPRNNFVYGYNRHSSQISYKIFICNTKITPFLFKLYFKYISKRGGYGYFTGCNYMHYNITVILIHIQHRAVGESTQIDESTRWRICKLYPIDQIIVYLYV